MGSPVRVREEVMIARKDGVSLKFFRHYYVIASVLDQWGWEVKSYDPANFREWIRLRIADIVGGVLLKVGKEKVKEG